MVEGRISAGGDARAPRREPKFDASLRGDADAARRTAAGYLAATGD